MIVSSIQIACEYKKLFRKKVIVYLKLTLFSDGTWEIAINKKYFKDKVTKRLWRDIEKYCRDCIVSAQIRTLNQIFKLNAKYKPTVNKYDPINRLDANYSECMDYVDYYQVFRGFPI